MVWTNYLDKQWRYRTLMTLFFQDDILLWSGHSAREMRPDWTSVVMPEQHWCCWSVEDFRSKWTQWQKKKNSFKFTDIMWKQAFSVGPFKTAALIGHPSLDENKSIAWNRSWLGGKETNITDGDTTISEMKNKCWFSSRWKLKIIGSRKLSSDSKKTLIVMIRKETAQMMYLTA